MKRKYAEGGGIEDYIAAHKEESAKIGRKRPVTKAPSKNPDDIPPRNLQDALDEVTRKKEDKAIEDVKKRKGLGFKKGGYVRAADGCAMRGKTKGKLL